MKKHNILLFVVPLLILSATILNVIHIVTEKNIFQVLCVIFSILAPVSFILWFKLTRVDDKKQREEHEKILLENDIDSFKISVQFKEEYGISFLEFIQKVKDNIEQHLIQSNENNKYGVHNPVILECDSRKDRKKRYFHELTLNGDKYFYLHLAAYYKSNIKNNTNILNDIILIGWNQKRLETYKTCTMEDFKKILHPYSDIIYIDFKTKKYKKICINKKTGYSWISEKNRAEYIFSFKEDLKIPQIAHYQEIPNESRFGPFRPDNCILKGIILEEPKFIKLNDLANKKEETIKSFNRGDISRTDYEKKIKSINVELEKMREQNQKFNNYN